VTLFNVMIHVLTETNRHAGHADILREQLNDKNSPPNDDEGADWGAHRERIERSARRAGAETQRHIGDVP
jgi:hypothetical protein